MTESEFLALAEAVLADIELRLERAAEAAEVDVELSRNGNVLEVEFIDNRSKIIINTQAPMQEIWIAARTGGFHYRLQGSEWRDSRNGSELYAALSEMASAQAGNTVTL